MCPRYRGKTPSRQGCIVPNIKMIEQTSVEVRECYIPFLANCIKEMFERNVEPIVILHEAMKDDQLIVPLQAAVGKPLRVIREPDPVCLKGIIGGCYILIGSRYHSLVSALSQGVPSLGTGWSHNYHSLFEDYHCGDYLVSVQDSPDKIHHKFNAIIKEPNRSDLIKTLKQASTDQIRKSVAMWEEVDRILNLQ